MQNYDPKKVSVIVDGHIVVGYMDGTFVTTEKNADNITPHIGADGDVTVTENADNTGKITLTIKQNSASLSTVIELANTRKEFSARVIDSNGTQKVGGTQCRIIKTPGMERGADVAGVEVQIFVADYAVSA